MGILNTISRRDTRMTILEAIDARHSVRAYQDKAIDTETREQLNQYLVKKKDIIPDNIPILGLVDDLAVLGVALKFCDPELKAFKAWRDGAQTNA